MKIKEVSEIVGVSKRTLQYYDDINLVKARRLKTIIASMMKAIWTSCGESYS